MATKKLRLITKLAQDVGVPREVAYNQWTQLEDFPEFMKGVESVELTPEEDDEEDSIRLSNWTVKIGITRRQFRAEVTEAVPDERIAWKSIGGAQHQGVVTFAGLNHNLTRVQVEMEYFPGDFIEKIGNIFLAARRKARKDLRLFKHYIELKGEETGAWRGEIVGEGEEPFEEGQEPSVMEQEEEEENGEESQDESSDTGSEEDREEASSSS